MRLIPDNIEHFNSLGEKILYLKFKNENPQTDCFVLHSVFTNFHFKNISGELDFLVLAPGHGVFAIEVKHGGVSRKDGTWHSLKWTPRRRVGHGATMTIPCRRVLGRFIIPAFHSNPCIAGFVQKTCGATAQTG